MSSRAASFAIVLVLFGCKSEKPEPAPTPPPAASASAAPVTSAPVVRADASGVVRIAAEAKAEEEYGYAIAMHEKRAVVTAYKRNRGSGAAFVYDLEGTRATRRAELVAETGAQLGNAVAFDGQRIAVGAMFAAGVRQDTGAVFVFEATDDGFSKPFKLASKQSKPDESFGIGVVLSGPDVIVADSAESGGHLFMFERAKSGWQQKQALPFPEANGPGEILSATGDWVVVGAQNAGEIEEQGAVYSFGRRGGSLVPDMKLAEVSPSKQAHFGGAVAIGGSRLAVASETHVTLFELQGGRWRQGARISPPEATGLADAALAVSGDRLAIGLPLVEEGRVLVYRKRGAQWAHERTLRAPDGKKNDWFGFSLALGQAQLVIGAPFADDRAGAAYVVAL